MEVWKDIYYIDYITGEVVDYRGFYQASNYGRIKSVDRIVERDKKGNMFIKGRVIKPFCVHFKYQSVDLSKNGISKKFKVHRIIANLFLNTEGCSNLEIDHIDANPENNAASNLRLVDHRTNCQNPNSYIRICKIEQLDMEGNYVKTWNSPSEAGSQLGIWQNAIKSCCDNKPHYLSAGGFKWRYAS